MPYNFCNGCTISNHNFDIIDILFFMLLFTLFLKSLYLYYKYVIGVDKND